MLQRDMIAKLRMVCEQDARLTAAMLYGSCAYGEDDEFSDIDVLMYFDDEALKGIDQRAWLAQIQPVALAYINEFGIHAVIFDNLVRGEFHFDPASELPNLARFRGAVWFPLSAILLDRTGELTQQVRALGETPQWDKPEMRSNLCDSFLNLYVFAMNVLLRGELGRALEMLTILNNVLLHMIRLDEKQTMHWFTPTRALEHDLSPDAYQRFIACTAPAEKVALWNAYQNVWRIGKAWIQAQRTSDDMLIDQIEKRLHNDYQRAMA